MEIPNCAEVKQFQTVNTYTEFCWPKSEYSDKNWHQSYTNLTLGNPNLKSDFKFRVHCTGCKKLT